MKPGDVLDFGPMGMAFHVKKTGRETDGRSLEMEWELAPRTGGTLVHTHPRAGESNRVLEGKLDVYVDGRWRTLEKGEEVTVDAGVAHTFRNAIEEPTRVYNVHSPAMRFDEYFEGLHRLANGGAFSAARLTPKAMLYLSVLMTAFREEIRTVKPPYAVIRLFGFIGRLLGYRIQWSASEAAKGSF